ncbi:MAG: hypothetical protein ABSG02_22825, partial [Terriglobales bacterium]
AAAVAVAVVVAAAVAVAAVVVVAAEMVGRRRASRSISRQGFKYREQRISFLMEDEDQSRSTAFSARWIQTQGPLESGPTTTIVTF